MEFTELRYFLAAAKEENLQRAGKSLHISVGSISKAISKLEEELGVLFFERVGRNIRLTEHGRLFQKRATQILILTAEVKSEIQGKDSPLSIVIVGSEYALGSLGIDWVAKLQKRFPDSVMTLQATDSDEMAHKRVSRAEADFALTSAPPPAHLQFKPLSKSKFQTCLSQKHPLFRRVLKGEKINVRELLTHPFVCPEAGVLGKVEGRASADGWRDDKFPRLIKYVTPNLKILEELVQAGLAMAYLPDFYINKMNFSIVTVEGCNEIQNQKVSLVYSELTLSSSIANFVQGEF